MAEAVSGMATLVASPSIVETYRRDGAVRVAGVLTAAEVVELSAELDRLDGVTENRPWTGAWRTSAPAPKDGVYSLKARHDVHRSSRAWGAFVADGRCQALAEALLGCRAVLDHSTMVIKPPDTGQPFPLHQDAAYFPHDRPFVLLSVHLDTTTPENGALRVLPGNHQGFLQHVRDGKAYLDPQIYRLEDAVEVCADAGDIVAFSIFTPHGSFPNRSSETRRLVRLGWRAA